MVVHRLVVVLACNYEVVVQHLGDAQCTLLPEVVARGPACCCRGPSDSACKAVDRAHYLAARVPAPNWVQLQVVVQQGDHTYTFLV